MNKPHALSLAFQACSVAVEVCLAHLLPDDNSYTWLGRPEGNNHSSPLLPPSLSCADNEQSNQIGEKHRKIVSRVIEKLST